MKREMEKKTANQAKFKIPECTFYADCCDCTFYERYGFGKAYCNYYRRDIANNLVEFTDSADSGSDPNLV